MTHLLVGGSVKVFTREGEKSAGVKSNRYICDLVVASDVPVSSGAKCRIL